MLNQEAAGALDYALSRGFVVHPDVLGGLEGMDGEQVMKIIKDLVREKTRQGQYHINGGDLAGAVGGDSTGDVENDHEILFDPTQSITTAEGVDGYAGLFANRLAKLKAIASERPEFKKTVAAGGAVAAARGTDDVYLCGLVTEKSLDRSVVKLVIEDATGQVEVVVFNEEQREMAQVLLLDQFVIVRAAAAKGGGLVAKELIQPDVPDRKTNRSRTETHAAFLSDLHVGSRYFMEEEFREFAKWLGSADPIAQKIKFVLIAGDLVDGVGIYPNQDKELVYITLESQLAKFEEILSMMPDGVKVFMTTGNHDPGRRALPQPAIPRKYNGGLWQRKNWHMLGNPSLVSLNGVKVLMFHGQSIDDIVKTTPGLSYDGPVEVMKCLIRARHMSPIYGSQTPIAPELEDMLVMETVPEIFHVGHVHVVGVDIYKGVLLVNSGAWQAQTPFQSSVGVTPTPGVAVIVNLKTFKVFTKSFV